MGNADRFSLLVTVVISMFLMVICSLRSPDALPRLLLTDGYETYPAGSYLPSSLWRSSSPEAFPQVTDEVAFNGTNSLMLKGPVHVNLSLPRGLERASYAANIMIPELDPDHSGTVLEIGFSHSASSSETADIARLEVLGNGAVYFRTLGGYEFHWMGLEAAVWHSISLVADLADNRAAAWINEDLLDEVPIGAGLSASIPRLGSVVVSSLAEGARAFIDDLDIYRVPFVSTPKLRSCVTGEPHRSGDFVNLIFENTHSLEETLAYFDKVVAWPDPSGSDLCIQGSDGSLSPQDDSRASHGPSQERWHVRFYHDHASARTLAAAHRDTCGGKSVGHLCKFFRPHQGVEFNSARDEIAHLFALAGFDVSLMQQVSYIVFPD